MSTLAENILLLLLLYIVYSYRPQAGDTSPTYHPPTSPPAEGTIPESTMQDSQEASHVSDDDVPLPETITVFRARVPLVAMRSPSVQYEVAVKVESPADILPTVHRVFDLGGLDRPLVNEPPFPSAPERSSSPPRSCPSPMVVDEECTPLSPRALEPFHASKDDVPVSRPRAKGLMTPPPSTRSTAVPRDVKAARPLSSIRPMMRPTTTPTARDGLPRSPSIVKDPLSRPQTPAIALDSPAYRLVGSSAAGPSTSAKIMRVKVKSQKKKKFATRASPFPSFERQFRTFRNYAGVLSDDGQPVGTGWFRSEANAEVAAPPAPSAFSDGLHRGDVYYHCTPNGHQLWLLVGAATTGALRWHPVTVGYRREDGRKLSLTKGNRDPSWVL
ncbi:hypothetical protein C2E23DRAFT_882408 [Lenzites betulinus]|nr:hypothetical protein C2E23DRAFT_882408 [Lenzites betulinus]